MDNRTCPQLLQLVRLGKGNAFRPKKQVWEWLGGKRDAVVVATADAEVRLCPGESSQAERTAVVKGKVVLPASACRRLKVGLGDQLALIERRSAIAVIVIARERR